MPVSPVTVRPHAARHATHSEHLESTRPTPPPRDSPSRIRIASEEDRPARPPDVPQRCLARPMSVEAVGRAGRQVPNVQIEATTPSADTPVVGNTSSGEPDSEIVVGVAREIDLASAETLRAPFADAIAKAAHPDRGRPHELSIHRFQRPARAPARPEEGSGTRHPDCAAVAVSVGPPDARDRRLRPDLCYPRVTAAGRVNRPDRPSAGWLLHDPVCVPQTHNRAQTLRPCRLTQVRARPDVAGSLT